MRLRVLSAQEWLEMKRPALAPRSFVIEKTNLGHLLPIFGRLLISDIGPENISHYQQMLREGASPKTVNLEVGPVRGILRRNRLWANVQQDVRLLATKDDFGRAINTDEQNSLLQACLKSRSRCLYPATVLLWIDLSYRNALFRCPRSPVETGGLGRRCGDGGQEQDQIRHRAGA